jgi:hypothetical protein
MRASIAMFVLCGLIGAASPALAQRGADGDRPTTASGADAFVAKLMKFDKNHDGKLTKDEITDERLLPLFERADANHDGVVTADELKALFAKEGASLGRRGRRGPDDSFANADDPPGQRRGQPGAGPDRPGPDGPGPGDPNSPGEGPGPGFGPGGPGGPGGPPPPGQVLSERLQEMLKLTADQKKQLADLQKEVDEKLSKILTADQQKQLKDMRNRRPQRRGGGPNGPDGGPGGPGDDRGGPPGGDRRPGGRGGPDNGRPSE